MLLGGGIFQNKAPASTIAYTYGFTTVYAQPHKAGAQVSIAGAQPQHSTHTRSGLTRPRAGNQNIAQALQKSPGPSTPRPPPPTQFFSLPGPRVLSHGTVRAITLLPFWRACSWRAGVPACDEFSQSVITTLLARSSRPTLTLYSGLLSSVRLDYLHLLLSSGRSSYFRMVF